MTATTEPTPKQQRQAERKRLKLASLNEQLAWWASPDRRSEGFQVSALRAECKRIEKRRRRLLQLVPSSRWHDDAMSLPLHAGGEFPPTDEQGVPLMVRALGEVRFYPPIYLTSSGHSFDTYVEAVYTGDSAMLSEDGYNGSRVTIYQLSPYERRKLHDMENRVRATRRNKSINNLW